MPSHRTFVKPSRGTSDARYIDSKLAHMQRLGIKADYNPLTGAARPDWARIDAEERAKRYNRKH